MALTVGTDSYISVADATTYIANNYVSTSALYTTWNALSAGDKEIYLKKATKKIDRQMLRGIKAIDSQVLEFPRALRSNDRFYNNNIVGVSVNRYDNYVVESEVSQAVKDAQVEEAVSLSGSGGALSNRQSLQQQGVKSFSLGDLSESYGTGLSSSFNSTVLTSSEAKELLKYYLAGGVRIC